MNAHTLSRFTGILSAANCTFTCLGLDNCFNCTADIAHGNLATRVLKGIPHNWIRSYMEQ